MTKCQWTRVNQSWSAESKACSKPGTVRFVGRIGRTAVVCEEHAEKIRAGKRAGWKEVQ